MKRLLDWQEEKVVEIYDEINLWSAPFGRLLLENIPMRRGMHVVDLGFGTGFPLIELSQRFGNDSHIYGYDIWNPAIKRAKKKIETLEIENVTIFHQSAAQIQLESNTIDLVTSNLGINNFDERERVYSQVNRVLKVGGALAITTNPIGTFTELFEIFEETLTDLRLAQAKERLKSYLSSRKTSQEIISEIEQTNLKHVKTVRDETMMRFTNSKGLLNHSLMRVGFRAGWDEVVEKNDLTNFYNLVIEKIDQEIERNSEFKISIPMLYLEFTKG